MQKGMVHPDGGITPPPGAVLYKKTGLPSHLTRRRQRRRSCACHRGRCCMTSLCSSALVLAVLIGIAILVFWLYVRPKSLHYSIGGVGITGLAPNTLAAATKKGTLSTQTTFTIEARNPNTKIGYSYDTVTIDAEILGMKVGGVEIAAFFQGHDNTTFLTENLKSGPMNVINLAQAGVLSASQAHAVPLDVYVDMKARIKISSWKSPKFKIKVRCSAVVNPSIQAAIGTPGTGCSYKTKFWIF